MRELIEPTFAVDANSYHGRACSHSNLLSTVWGSRCIEIHSTDVCHTCNVGNFFLEGWKSNQEILLAWYICQVEEQVKEQVSAQDRALMIGMMARGKIIRNDGWSFPFEWVRISKCRTRKSEWLGAAWGVTVHVFQWKTLFSKLRLLFRCILL